MHLIWSSSLGSALDVVERMQVDRNCQKKKSKVLQSRYTRESIPRGST